MKRLLHDTYLSMHGVVRACVVNVSPNGFSISFPESSFPLTSGWKTKLPELSFSDRWSMGTRFTVSSPELSINICGLHELEQLVVVNVWLWIANGCEKMPGVGKL